MSSVDNRIVKMSMENGQFTSAANSTMSTLKKLGDSLKLTEGSKGLEDIAKKAKGVDMSTLSSGVEEVRKGFSMLDIVGVAALVNITNSAINAGKNMVKSLTIDPVMQGFSEYETKMGSITTIMTNTAHAGTTMKQVTDVLDELNLYADQTIYNFAEMTRNIGTFTAAGVDLKTSATAIKGIANLAAGSGSTSQQASTAMYQLSQAIASGTVKLQDWNSVVNAGMGGKLFQNALEKTAESMGQGRNMAVSFRDSLQDGWITTEVLTKTLADFAADESLLKAATQVKTYTQLIDTMKESVQSGWAQSWEFILGDKDEAAKFFTAISDGFNNMMGPMTEYRNVALKLWSEQGGREALINGMANAAKTLGAVLGPVYNSFKKIIDPWNGQRLVDMSKGFQKITESIKITDKTSALLSKTFDGVFSVFSIIGKVAFGVASTFASFVPLMTPIVDGILSITSVVGDYAVGVNGMLDSTNILSGMLNVLKDIISGVSSILGGGLEFIAGGLNSIKNIDLSGLQQVGSKIAQSFTPVEKVGALITGVIDGIKWAMMKMIPIAAEFGTKVWGVMSKISQAIIDTLGGKGNALNNIVSGGLLAAIALGIKKLIDVVKNFEADFGGVKGIIESVTSVFDGVKDSLESFQNGIKANTLKKIAVAIGILAASLVVISLIDSSKLVSSLATMGTMMGELVASMVILDKLGGGAKVGLGVVLFASAILVLSKALKNVEGISWENTAKGLLSIGTMMAMMVGASKFIETESKGMVKSAAAMVIFAAAINVLSKALEFVGNLDPVVIINGLTGIGLLMLELSVFMKVTDLSGMSISKAAGILIFAQSMKVMGDAMAKIGSLDPVVIVNGLIGIGVVLAELGVFMRLVGNPKGMISTATSMVIIGGSLLVLSMAIEKMGNLNPIVIANGLITMGTSLSIIAAAMRIMPKNIMSQSISLVIIGGALLVIGEALAKMGGLKPEVIANGLIAMGSSLIILSVAVKAMQGSLKGASALIIVAGAIAILTPALKAMGSMSIQSIGKSLLMLAGTFTVLGVAGLVLTPITPVLLALGAAVGLLGVACLAVGVGISAFAAGLALLTVSGTAGAAALVIVVTSLLGLIPTVGIVIAEGLVNIIKVFLDNTAILAEALTNFLIVIVKSLTAAIPAVVDLVSTIINSLLDLIVQLTPKIVAGVVQVIVEILNTLISNIPKIAGFVTESILQLIATVLQKIAEGIPKISRSIVNVIVAIINSIGDGVPRIVNAIFDMVIKMIDGLANAVETKMPQVRAAIKRLTTAIITEFKSAVKDAVNVGGNIVDGLKNGIANGIESVKEAARNVASSALRAAKNFLDIHSPSREFAKLGMYSDQGLANGLIKHKGVVEDSAVSVADMALSGMRTALSTVNDLFNLDVDTQPVIRPVLDLSEIQNGTGQIGSILGGSNAIKVSANAARETSAGFFNKTYTGFDSAPITNDNSNTNNIVNHFNITGDNPKEIANEVSRILQKQVERKSILWE